MPTESLASDHPDKDRRLANAKLPAQSTPVTQDSEGYGKWSGASAIDHVTEAWLSGVDADDL